MSSASQDIRLCDHCKYTFSKPLRTRELMHTTFDKLRAHYIPSCLEREHVSHALLAAQADLDSYDKEICRLEEILLKLKTQRVDVQNYADACRGLHAPIRRLPTEVLGQVFAYSAPQRPGDNTEEEPNSDGTEKSVASPLAIFTLGLVCARWRGIILSAQRLWATIIVDLDVYGRPTYDATNYPKVMAMQEILDAYIQRSGDEPLSISLLRWSTEDAPKLFHDAFRSIYDALAYQSYRWRRASIIIDVEDEDLCQPFWSNIREHLPKLEELQIRDIDSITPAFDMAPKLQTLTLLDYYGEHNHGAVPFQWAQIRALVFRGHHIEVIPTACSLLERLEIKTGSVQFGLTEDPMCLANLSHLSFYNAHRGDNHIPMTRGDLSDLFESLTLPCMKSLEIGNSLPFASPKPSTTNIWPDKAFTSFLSRSSCSLNELCLENIPMTATTLLAILTLTPALTTLKIHEIPQWGDGRGRLRLVTDTLLRSMTHYPDTSYTTLLVPRLTHIELQAAPFFSDHILLDMVESRWLPESLHSHGSGDVACLDYVTISYMNRALDSTSLSRLRVMNRQGLKTVLL